MFCQTLCWLSNVKTENLNSESLFGAMKLNCGALLLLAIATTYWQICAAVEQRDGGGLSNDDMLASLTAAINDDEGSDTEWEISRLKRVQAVREGEQQRERLRQGREEALRERAALQQQVSTQFVWR